MSVCAWCQQPTPARDVAPAAAPVSHGICPSCLAAQMARLASAPLVRPTALSALG